MTNVIVMQLYGHIYPSVYTCSRSAAVPSFYSVDAYVPGGEYDFGAQIVFEEDVVISLDEDGVMITFSENNLGPSAKFVAGQTTWKQECSMGCQVRHNRRIAQPSWRADFGALPRVLYVLFLYPNGPSQLTQARAPCVEKFLRMVRTNVQRYSRLGQRRIVAA